MTGKAPRIRWHDTAYGGLTGHVGAIEPWLFQIWKAEADAGEWVLMSTLHGQRDWRLYCDGTYALKVAAEAWLADFAAALGASFPAAPQPAPTAEQLMDALTPPVRPESTEGEQ